MPQHPSARDWDISADTRGMIARLFPHRSEGSRQEISRRERLYLCSLARRDWRHLHEESRALVAAAERLADGQFPPPFPFAAARRIAETVADCDGDPTTLYVAERTLAGYDIASDGADTEPYVQPARWRNLHSPEFFAVSQYGPTPHHVELRYHDADRLRDIFPLPDGSLPAFRTTWRTAAAVALAEEMYSARAFGRVPILGDILQDTGCDDPAVLAHCRDRLQPHARGCWVIDLLMGKT